MWCAVNEVCYYSANVKRLVGENEVLQDDISKVSYYMLWVYYLRDMYSDIIY